MRSNQSEVDVFQEQLNAFVRENIDNLDQLNRVFSKYPSTYNIHIAATFTTTDSRGNTLIHYLSQSEKPEAKEILEKAIEFIKEARGKRGVAAALTAPDSRHNTPLHYLSQSRGLWAEESLKKVMVRILLSEIVDGKLLLSQISDCESLLGAINSIVKKLNPGHQDIPPITILPREISDEFIRDRLPVKIEAARLMHSVDSLGILSRDTRLNLDEQDRIPFHLIAAQTMINFLLDETFFKALSGKDPEFSDIEVMAEKSRATRDEDVIVEIFRQGAGELQALYHQVEEKNKNRLASGERSKRFPALSILEWATEEVALGAVSATDKPKSIRDVFARVCAYPKNELNAIRQTAKEKNNNRLANYPSPYASPSPRPRSVTFLPENEVEQPSPSPNPRNLDGAASTSAGHSGITKSDPRVRF